MNQFSDTKELTELVNEALNMFKLKYHPELKDVLTKIKAKFNNDGFEYALNALFKQNFSQIYEDFKQLDIEAIKLNPKLVNSVIFNLLQLEELSKLKTLLNDLKTQGTHIDPKQ